MARFFASLRCALNDGRVFASLRYALNDGWYVIKTPKVPDLLTTAYNVDDADYHVIERR
jgi:hypothetical protein